MGMSIRARLSRFCAKRKFITLSRRLPGKPRHRAFVLDVGEELILLNQFRDFRSEGLAALRVDDIESVKFGASERLFGEIIASERSRKKSGRDLEIGFDLGSTRALLDSLRANRRICIIECESEDDPDEDVFNVCRVLSVSDEIVSIRCFDELGNWHTQPRQIAISSITKCQMKTPYINVFSRYLASAARKRKKNND